MSIEGRPTTGPFEKTKGWLDWFDGPSKPRFALPEGAVDAHCHVFGPGAEFPYAATRKYTPCDASKLELFALRDRLGFSRNVIVQATCHGDDNSAMVDACLASGGRARGAATVKRSVTDEELKRLNEAGVRGVRFNFVKRLVDFTPRDELMEIAGRIAADEYRHYKLFYDTLKKQDEPDLPFWRKLLVAAGRVGESDDDELAYAFYCANVKPEEEAAKPYRRRRYAKLSAAAGMRIYRRHHIQKLVQMVAKAVGANPHGKLARAAGSLLWRLIRVRAGFAAEIAPA